MIELDRLLKLRLVVGRHGEMDRACWWNTNAMLGRYGEAAVGRGLPRTHRFVRARVVFAVAEARCKAIYDPRGSITLWSLPAAVEDAFKERWQDWVGAPDQWDRFFDELGADADTDLIAELSARSLITEEQAAQVGAARRSAEGRALELTAETLDDHLVGLLAAGFAKGEPGAPTIPFAKVSV
jgi:hypothetical protein